MFVCRQWVRSHVTINHDALDIIKQGPPPLAQVLPLCRNPQDLAPRTYSNLFNLDLTIQGPPDMFKLVHYEAHTVCKRVVSILLECFLVLLTNSSTNIRGNSGCTF